MSDDVINTESEATGAAATARAVEADLEGESTDQTAPTIRDVFGMSENADGDLSGEQWDAMRERLNEEVKGIKWTAAMPDLASKVFELLDVAIPNILVTAWKKVEDIQEVLKKSASNPDEVTYLELAEHTINSEHKPSVDVRLRGATVKKIEIGIQMAFKLQAFVLKIQNGGIRQVQSGQCEVKGAIKYGSLNICEKKLSPLKLPLMIPINWRDEESQEATPEESNEEMQEASNEDTDVERIEV